MKKKLNVQIFQNGNNLSIQGDGSNVEKNYDALQKLYTEAGKGLEITQEILHLCLQEDQPDDTSQIKTPRKVIKPRTKNQRVYLENMNKYEINFGIGPAGTSKTYLAMAKLIDYLLNKKVEKIILIRPAVEAGEKLGFLPGDLSQKVDPYLRPLYDAMYAMLEAR